MTSMRAISVNPDVTGEMQRTHVACCMQSGIIQQCTLL